MESVIPTPDAIPVNWWWFQILLLFTFLVHVILMNFVLGGSLLALFDMLRKKNPAAENGSLPTLVALTINFGVPPLLFVQVLYGHLFYSSSILMAVPWILVIPILILAYYGAHIFKHRLEKSPRLAKTSLGITAILLLLIAFIYVNNNTLALTPSRWGSYFEKSGGWSLNLGEPTLFPRYLHMVIGAVAIAGLGKALWYKFSRKGNEDSRKLGIKSGLKIFGWGTLVQMAAGTWFWLTLPNEMWKLFMGQNIGYTILMTVGWILALLILHSSMTGRLWMSVGAGVVTLIIMVIIRDLVRHAYLGEVFRPADLPVARDVSPLIAFLAVFVAGLGSLYYMIRIAFKPKSE